MFSEWHIFGVAHGWGRDERSHLHLNRLGNVAIGPTLWSGKEASKLRFEVNGQLFFVNFVPEEGRWFCYAPTDTGMQKIPVSMDASPFEAYTVEQDEQAKEILN
jgi:hypothetical protein